MKKVPNSKVNLDRALQRYAGDYTVANKYRVAMANAIVAQMIGDGVVKGGSSLKFRFGDKATRYTMDLDTAWHYDLDTFLGCDFSSLKNRACQHPGEDPRTP